MNCNNFGEPLLVHLVLSTNQNLDLSNPLVKDQITLSFSSAWNSVLIRWLTLYYIIFIVSMFACLVISSASQSSKHGCRFVLVYKFAMKVILIPLRVLRSGIKSSFSPPPLLSFASCTNFLTFSISWYVTLPAFCFVFLDPEVSLDAG